MQWTPEHAQWAEQHFDISSTTRSPAHKVESYRGHLQRTYQYAWANDDISALTASNLLKKYAEKYSGILEGPGERALLCSYAEGTPGLLNGRKSESDSWQEGIYPMNCAPDVVSVSKAGMTAGLPPTDVSASIGSSPGALSSLAEASYSSSNCGSHAAASIHSALSSQEYAGSYNGSYLHSSYSGQTPPALASPHPSPLHSAGLLQPPPPPPPPPPTLVPSYNAGPPNLSNYNYPPAGYPPQTAVAPGYSPGGGPPSSSYLPSGIAAPTPSPSSLTSYTYQSHGHAPIAPTPLNGSSANSLKRKAFYMSGHGELDSSYGHFSYSQQNSSQSPMYRAVDRADRAADSGPSDSSRGNGFDRNAEATSLVFKSTKQPASTDLQRKCGGQSSRAPSPPPPYGPTKTLHPCDSFGKFRSPTMSETSEEHRQHLSAMGPATSSTQAAEEQLKNSDTNLVEMVTTEILQQAPPVDWSDIVGLEGAKATIKEEILWPILRPDMFSGLASLPRSLLLFGPQGSGRTLLARCMASQLGAAFLRLSGSALITKWLGDGEKIVQASFLVARCRQPSVVFISEVDVLLSAQLSDDGAVGRIKSELLMQLDSLLGSADEAVLVVCSSSRPQDIPDTLRRYFSKRLLVPLPDSASRHHMISQLLSQHNYCLSDKEVSLLVQRTEGFSGLDVSRLCQEAMVGPLHSLPPNEITAMHPSHMRAVAYQDFDNVFCKFQPSISAKELDTYTEWNKMFGCSQ